MLLMPRYVAAMSVHLLPSLPSVFFFPKGKNIKAQSIRETYRVFQTLRRTAGHQTRRPGQLLYTRLCLKALSRKNKTKVENGEDEEEEKGARQIIVKI